MRVKTVSKYLIEIGTEELPYKFIPSALEQLKTAFKKALSENRIEFQEIKTYGTPRRLTVIVEDITSSQPDIKKELKGPPAKIAFDENGNLSQAGLGFAKKQNIDTNAIYKKDIKGVEYLFANVEEKGKSTGEVLSALVPNIVLKLQGSHFMRWGDFDIKFSRPIRWILSLLDSQEVKVQIENVESSKYTRGHRFYEEKEIEINNPEEYFDVLYKAKVIVDQEKRLAEVEKKAKEAAEKAGATVKFDPELLKEVTYILEWPVPVIGDFDKKYLEIPDDVTVTVMASHQRYFPLYDDEGKLLNRFITMANYIGDAFDNIKAGNERVIRARLDDAIFFYQEDNKKTLESRLEQLKGVTFQKSLGSVYDKVNRIRESSLFIATEMDLDKKTAENIERAAKLCKADLVTNLVFEFTELQGFIGADYARQNGENDQVAQGIKEHYFPLSADGDLAESITGQVVGIADKIDTLCGVFAIGKIPTGSADPLGLRRAALGSMQTIINKNLSIDLSKVIENSVSLQPIEIDDKDKLLEQIRDFVVQRLKIFLNENYRYDVVDAAISAKDPLADLCDLMKRIQMLTKLVGKDSYNLFHESANRVSRIIKTADYKTTPDDEIFVQEVESKLWNCIKSIDDNKLTYENLIENLEKMIPTIEEFFDNVLVMDEDLKVRENRISLLGNLRSKFMKLADFSKIVA